MYLQHLFVKNKLMNKDDIDFSEYCGYTIKQYTPWQFGLFHSDLKGKLMWYPKKGSLIYEPEPYRVKKIGEFYTLEDALNSAEIWK
jgi:hypothetical protein